MKKFSHLLLAGILVASGSLSGRVSAVSSQLRRGFVLETAGQIVADPAQIISGTRSINGAYSGSGSYQPYLRTDPNALLLAPKRTYRITFRYRIVTAPDKGFEVLFFSPTGASSGNFLPSYLITGIAGSVGAATLTNTLADYGDYQARWDIVGKGSIVIDDIQIVDVLTGTTVATEDAEGTGIQFNLAQAFLPAPQAGHTFSVALAALGGKPPYTWKTGIITPPVGVQLESDGYLSGKPIGVGSYAFDVVITDSSGASDRMPIRLTVNSAPNLPPADPLTITNNTVTIRPQEYPLPFRNPLGGMRPNIDQAKAHPFASLGRKYVEWNLLENTEADTVDKIRAVTDQLFGDLPGYNIKAIPRVYLIWPQPLAKYWPADLQPDDYTSPAFRSRMKRLIARLGEAWNNDPRIAFIETGIIGYWGEQHDPGFSSSGLQPSLPSDLETDFGDAFRDAFPNKLLMNRYPRNLVGYQFGIHWDVFGAFDRGFWGNDTTGMTAELQTANHIDRWKIAPRGGEIDPTFLNEPDFSAQSLKNVVLKYTPRLVDVIQRLRWNHLAVLGSLDASDQDLWNKASQIQNALGYRFIIDEAGYPAALRPGQGLSLHLKIRNSGSSPFYYQWPLEVALTDARTRRPVWRSIWDGVDIRTWLPGDSADIQRTFSIPFDLAAGQYVVTVAILDPSGMLPAARFAVANYWMGGRTPLGPISVGGANPTLQLNEFDDLQADRSLYYLPPGDVSVPPVVVIPPYSQSVVACPPLTLTAAATGALPLSYQWNHDGRAIIGATSNSLTIANVQPADAGSYTVVVTNAAGSVTSTAATLKVSISPRAQ
jgi:hypothetical protein